MRHMSDVMTYRRRRIHSTVKASEWTVVAPEALA
jgi:hypothetical protein